MFRKRKKTSMPAKMLLSASAALSCMLILPASCTMHEMEVRSTGSSELQFRIGGTLSWDSTAGTRSSVQTGYGTPILTETVVEGDSICLVPVVYDGIESGGSREIQTKGTQMNQSNFHDKFGIYGYSYPESAGFDQDHSTPDYMFNVAVSKRDDGIYRTDNPFYLPAEGTDVTFFAYAPYGNWTFPDGPIPSAGSEGTPAFEYEVPHYSVNQPDICFTDGVKVKGGSSGDVELQFHHIFAAVRLVASEDIALGSINNVVISGVNNSGVYTPSADGTGNGSWKLNTSTGGFVINNPDNVKEVGNGTRVDITGDGETFFMPPQTVPAGATIGFDFTPAGGTVQHVTANIGGQVWTAGTTTVYLISGGPAREFNVEAASPLNNIAYNGADLTFNVLAREGSTPLEYVVEYSDDASDGSWRTVWTSSGASANLSPMVDAVSRQSVSSGNFNFRQNVTIGEAAVKYDNNTQAALANNGPKGTPEKHLSLADGTSSNCYIVDGWGYYEIPAVPGNSWKNGAANNDVLGKYIGYDGNIINSSNIWMNIARAEVIWQDVSGLVQDVSVYRDSSNGRCYIRFSVPQSSISEGNAVIAALNTSGTVMWSWHIWVVTGTTTVALTGADGNSRQILDRPIGFVEGGNKSWRGRSGHLRFRLAGETAVEEGVNTFTFDLSQSDGPSITTNGRYTLYQWGRKDPMCPIERRPGGSIATAEVFTNGYTAHIPNGAKLGSSAGITEWIKNPEDFSTNNTGSNVLRADLWNAALSSSANTAGNDGVTKSIYDPSPKGYKVPPRQVFGGLLKNGLESTLEFGYTNLRWYPADTQKYLIFSAGNQLIIPMSGIVRFVDNFQVVDGYYGVSSFFWTAGKPSQTIANQLYIYASGPAMMPSGVVDIYGNSRSDGPDNMDIRNAIPVIPVKE